jgi:hypothetical protein
LGPLFQFFLVLLEVNFLKWKIRLLREGWRFFFVVEELVEGKTFSCRKCGKPFEAYPPDDAHTTALMERSKDAVEITYECENGHENPFYWTMRRGPQRTFVATRVAALRA